MDASLPSSTRSLELPGQGDAVQWQADRPSVAGRPRAQRSAITNDPLFLRGVDGRSAAARRYRDLCMSLADDLGGAAALSAPTQAMIRQAAAIMIQAEEMQSKVVAGEEDVDLEELTRVSNVLSRLLHRLALRKQRPAPTSPLAEHFSRPVQRSVAP